MNIRVVARIEAQPDKVEEVRELLLALVDPTRKEAGCVTYELLQNLKRPTDFTFVEEWTSEAALEAHSKSAHLQAVGPKLQSIITAPPDIRVYATIR